MDETLTLNDGTLLENTRVLLSAGSLFFYVGNGMTMDEVYQFMKQPELTKHMTVYSFKQTTEYNGYTELYCISVDKCLVSGGLRRPYRE